MNIIADIGSNWRLGSDTESRKRASKLIKEAVRHGANTVKFQLFKADKLYREPKKGLSNLELPPEWLRSLKRETGDLGAEFLVTPFYLEAVDLLEEIEVERYKVASSDSTYTPLLERIGKTDKPVVYSTGAATFEEVENGIIALRPDEEVENGIIALRPDYEKQTPTDVVLLHCVPNYPAPLEDLQLKRILDLATEFFPMDVGFSSHCMLPHLTASSVLYYANTIEVHFDLTDQAGAESGHSYTPQMLSELVKMTQQYKLALDCKCEQTFSDFDARKHAYRDPSDWLRPIK
jgi:sialic acid synthase SpsE